MASFAPVWLETMMSARYFFDLNDGEREPDEIGIELADAAAAQREAIRYAGEVLLHSPDRLRHGALRVEVREGGAGGGGGISFVIEVRCVMR